LNCSRAVPAERAVEGVGGDGGRLRVEMAKARRRRAGRPLRRGAHGHGDRTVGAGVRVEDARSRGDGPARGQRVSVPRESGERGRRVGAAGDRLRRGGEKPVQ